MYDVVVVGAGPAGLAAGIAARQSGADVLIIEQGKPLALRTHSDRTDVISGIGGAGSILMESSHSTLPPQPSGQFGRITFLLLDISGSAKLCPLKV